MKHYICITCLDEIDYTKKNGVDEELSWGTNKNCEFSIQCNRNSADYKLKDHVAKEL